MATSFKLLRTDSADKRPTAAQLSIGELGLNYDANTPGLFFEDDAGSVRKIGPMEVSSSAPNASPAGSSGNSAGELWLDNSSGHVLKYYTGSAWTAITNTGEAGSNTQVIFNDGGSYAGDSNFTFDKDNDVLSVTEVEGRLDGPVVFEAKSSGALSKGDVVYVSSVSGNFPVVAKAQADSASTMPAFGIANNATSGADETVVIVTLGTLSNIDTDTPGFTLGDTLYISATTAGSLTATAPTGEGNLVQNIGRVQKVHTSTGQIKVGGSGRTNQVPNLNNGNIFIGNGSNQGVTDAFTDVLSDQAGISSAANAIAMTIDSSERVGIGTTSPTAKLHISGDGNNSSRIFLSQAVAGTDGVDISGYRSRGSIASPGALADGDTIIKMFAQAHNGTTFVGAGNAGWTASDGSGNSTYSVKTRAGGTLADRLTIDSSGNVGVTNLSFSSAGDILIPDNSALALEVKEGTNTYLSFTTTDGSEKIAANKPTSFASTVSVGGDLTLALSSSVTPANNGELMVEATNDTTLTFKLKGSDGTVRTGTITLS